MVKLKELCFDEAFLIGNTLFIFDNTKRQPEYDYYNVIDIGFGLSGEAFLAKGKSKELSMDTEVSAVKVRYELSRD